MMLCIFVTTYLNRSFIMISSRKTQTRKRWKNLDDSHLTTKRQIDDKLRLINSKNLDAFNA